jgi:CDP-diacylglycerol--glycerol-3-phosphate 3-phosphatidyltransferase
MANIITGSRILISVVLLLCPALSPAFFLFYMIAGITDMADGAVARKTGTVCKFGSRFDSIADFVFVTVCLIKILPVMDIPLWLYEWITIIALIKISNIIFGYAIQKRFVAVHTLMNKATGMLLFMLPMTLSIFPLKYSGLPICLVATFAAIHEGLRIGRNNQ